MQKHLKKFFPFLPTAIALIAPAAALAVVGSENIVPNTIAPINNIVTVIRGIIRFILVVAFIIAFIMLLIGGIRWITAGGDEKGVAGARNMITAALIGLVVILVAYAIIRLVEIFFKVEIISGPIQIPQYGD
ncbi:hypothetical protein HY382_00455 [Candidatus Curtissbacteria bacterium]|nr:hypothetical protein [Candidatus Curtissbacteria bacterium]